MSNDNARHRAVCAGCGQDWPCDSLHDQIKADLRAKDHQERVRRVHSAKAGDCMGCAQPITSRQKRFEFPGPNLWRPDLEGSAAFHARENVWERPTGGYGRVLKFRCRSEVEMYDAYWTRAWPGRHSLVVCRGFVVEHQDAGRTRTCDNPLCPDGGIVRRRGIVDHRGHFAQCYVVHEECPRDCDFPAGATKAREGFLVAGAVLDFDTSGPREVREPDLAPILPLGTA